MEVICHRVSNNQDQPNGVDDSYSYLTSVPRYFSSQPEKQPAKIQGSGRTLSSWVLAEVLGLVSAE